MNYRIEYVNTTSVKEVENFLNRHEDFSLFLLSNLLAHGFKLNDEANSGNFKLVRKDDDLVAVFCLVRRGNLLITSEDKNQNLFNLILDSCQKEKLHLKGLLGEWSFCDSFWNFIKEKKIIQNETFSSKEVLYTVEFAQIPKENQPNTRLLVPSDFKQWEPLRVNFLKEQSLPNDLTRDELHHQFVWKCEQKIAWGLFLDKKLLAVAELNAFTKNVGQVGNVFTHPSFRKRGLAQAVMRQLIRDSNHLHTIQKLIIFTGEDNIAARRLYEGLGGKHVGYFALLFGT